VVTTFHPIRPPLMWSAVAKRRARSQGVLKASRRDGQLSRAAGAGGG